MSSFGRHLYGFAPFCSIRILVISFGPQLRVALQQMSAFIQDPAGYTSKGENAAPWNGHILYYWYQYSFPNVYYRSLCCRQCRVHSIAWFVYCTYMISLYIYIFIHIYTHIHTFIYIYIYIVCTLVCACKDGRRSAILQETAVREWPEGLWQDPWCRVALFGMVDWRWSWRVICKNC